MAWHLSVSAGQGGLPQRQQHVTAAVTSQYQTATWGKYSKTQERHFLIFHNLYVVKESHTKIVPRF